MLDSVTGLNKHTIKAMRAYSRAGAGLTLHTLPCFQCMRRYLYCGRDNCIVITFPLLCLCLYFVMSVLHVNNVGLLYFVSKQLINR